MSGIQGITFDNQVVTAKDHGRLFHQMLSDGVISGCAITKTATSVTVGAGYLLVAGRLIRLTSAQTLTIALPSVGGFSRVLVTINLSGTATASQFNQVTLSTEFATAVANFRTLTKGDVNGAGTLYEYELCVLRVLTSGVYSVFTPPVMAAVDSASLGVLGVANGGTGKSSLAEHYLLLGNGASAVKELSPGTSGHILMSNGTGSDPAFKAQTNITQLGTVTAGVWHGSAIPIAYGGTGATSGTAAIRALFAAGATVLSSHQYGSTLPSAGTAGRIFFKTVG